MLDLKKYVLPKTIEVNGRTFIIRTSFKYWISFLSMLEEKNTTASDFDFMFESEVPEDKVAGLEALIAFCTEQSVLPRSDDKNDKTRVIDYDIDSDYIYAAFMEQYGIDLIESDMHYYKFQAMFKGLHKTKLNEIVGYRLWESSGRRDEYTRQMEKLRYAWELPEKDEDEDDESLKAFEEKLKS